MKVVLLGAHAESLLNFRGPLIKSLVDRGHEVLAIAPEDDRRVRTGIEALGASYATLELSRATINPIADLRSVLALSRLLTAFRPHAVLFFAAKPVTYGLIVAAALRIPMRAALITGIGSAFAGGDGVRRLVVSQVVRLLYAVALRGADVVFFQNADDYRLFRSLGLLAKRNRSVLVNGSGVDLTAFSPAPLPEAPTTFLMIARLIRDKGVFEYAHAARIARATRPELRFQLLGALDSNPTALTRDELASLQRDGVIEYLGVTEDVRPFITASHVSVLPSYREGMPRSILEAMAMSRPVVTTDVAGCRETVEQGTNGYLVAPRNPQALADALLRIASERHRFPEMGAASRRRAERRFNADAVAEVIVREMCL